MIIPREGLGGTLFLEGPVRVWRGWDSSRNGQGVLFENKTVTTPVGQMFDVVVISNNIKRV